jgi:O-antigen ligase
MAAFIVAGSLTLMRLLRTERDEDALHIGEGLWIGLLVGALYATVEIASGQAIKIWAYNLLQLGPDVLEPARYFTWENGRVVAVHPDDLTRNAVPIPLLIWPALMAATLLSDRIWRGCICVLLLLLSAVAVLLATSESAKLALLAGIVAFVMARTCARIARYVLSCAWIAACLAVVPVVLLARLIDLQNVDWLPKSAQIRVTLWNEIALLVARAPILGVGADMTYVIRPRMQETPLAAPSIFMGLPITHPHNVYLQVWYELGFVGATLLTVFGIMVLREIARLDAAQRPYAFALFAAAAIQIGFSYSIWQIWFLCLFGFAAAKFALGQNLLGPKRIGTN